MGFGKALVRGGLTESFRKLFPHVEVGEDTVREWVREHVAGRAVVPDVKGLRYNSVRHAPRIESLGDLLRCRGPLRAGHDACLADRIFERSPCISTRAENGCHGVRHFD